MVSMADVVSGSERWHVQHADCLFALSCLPDASVDAIVTDPPYGLGNREPSAEEIASYVLGSGTLNTRGDFMGKQWSVPPVSVWKECLRVLKPGGYVLAFGGTRTFDLIALGLRAAGFQFRDTIGVDGVLRWLQSQGMPKGLDVAKAIDEFLGVDPTVVGSRVLTGSAALSTAEKGGTFAAATRSAGKTKEVPVTEPTSPEAKAWDGWNVALKPTWEPILIFRKPLEGTVAANVLRHGTGALNIDGCRVAVDPEADASQLRPVNRGQRNEQSVATGWDFNAVGSSTGTMVSTDGRWPPNSVLCHLPGCQRVGTKRVTSGNPGNVSAPTPRTFYGRPLAARSLTGHADADGTEVVAAFECAPGCPVARLDEQSGECPAGVAVQRNGGGGHIFGKANTRGPVADAGYSDEGTASRFFPQCEWDPAVDGPSFLYVAKVASAERDAGLEGDQNTHVSIKPVELMRWLVRLVTPPAGLIVDPYVGSGTTGIAAMLESGGFRFLGIERDPEYVPIAVARIRHVAGGQYRTLAEIAAAAAADTSGKARQLGLF